MNDGMTFQQLLDNLGVSQYSGMLGSPQDIAQNLGFYGDQASEFSRFFPSFDRETFMKAAQSGQEATSRRLNELAESFQSGFSGLSQQLGQATQQLSGTEAEMGGNQATFGASLKARENLAGESSASIADLLSRREAGLLSIEEQEQRDQANLISIIQQYAQSGYRRGSELFARDPVDSRPEMIPTGTFNTVSRNFAGGDSKMSGLMGDPTRQRGFIGDEFGAIKPRRTYG
jgi:hypothetical protein